MKNLKKLFLPVLAAAFLAAPAQAADTLMMATTTSTQDTGLLEFLAPTFQKETGIELKWVAVGTGKALEIAKNWCTPPPLKRNPSRPVTVSTAVR